MWDAKTGRCMHTLQGHTSTVRCMAMSDNTGELGVCVCVCVCVCVFLCTYVRMYVHKYITYLHIFLVHVFCTCMCVFLHVYIPVVSLFYMYTHTFLHTYVYVLYWFHTYVHTCIHNYYVHTYVCSICTCVLYIMTVVSGSRDASLRLWDLTTGKCTGVLSGHVAAVRW